MIGVKVGIAGHLKIGDNVKMAALTGISNNVPDCKTMMGAPAMEASKYQRCYAVFRNLPNLCNEVIELSKREK